MSAQTPVMTAHRCQRYAYDGAGEPDQTPRNAVRDLPTSSVPLTVGAGRLTGAVAASARIPGTATAAPTAASSTQRSHRARTCFAAGSTEKGLSGALSEKAYNK